MACNGTDPVEDSGSPDATVDSGVEDSGLVTDAGVKPDAGFADTGPGDPNTITEGIEIVAGARTYMHLRGTTTSTMPPLIVLPTGPHMGGIAVFWGTAGGGIGHEYLPDHLDFLLPGRLMVYFDFRATGRSGYGAVGSATISAEGHVIQIEEMRQWLDALPEIDASVIDIMGHGYGAGIASLYAAEKPQNVSRLVLVTPMAPNVHQFVDGTTMMLSRITSSDRDRLDTITREPECRGNTSDCTVEVWRIIAPRLMCRATAHLSQELEFRYGDSRGYELIRFGLTNQSYDWSSVLATITAPTTVISGACDATPPEAAMVYSSTISGAVHHIIPDSGHFPMVEAPQTFQSHARRALTYP